jgi:hypothetical protein
VLKNSSHLWAIEALVEALPDVCLVQTHRNPIELISSISSLVYRMRRISEPGIRKQDVGRQQLDLWSRILEKNMASREARPYRIYDVHFESFTRDPIGTLERIYAFFELPWSPETEKNVRAWSEHNRKDQHGVHEYSSHEYGLSDELIADRFSAYIEWESAIRRAG